MKTDDFRPGDSAPPRPYQRRAWLAAVLTFFGYGLPLVYCGLVRAGILVEVITGFLTFGIFFLLPGFPSAILLWVILLASLPIFVAFLIYNVRLFRRYNDLNIPRFQKAWTWVISIFIIMIVVDELFSFSVNSFFAEAYRIPSSNMEKTLLNGDYLLAEKSINPDELKRGDLIIFKYPPDPHQNYIKRLIAKGGDKIKIVEKHVFLDGEFLEEPYVQFLDSRTLEYFDGRGEWGVNVRDNLPEITVPEGMLFVLGDNRDNSSDSRFWGFLDEELVAGRAMFVYFSWDSEGNRIRWDRIGMRLDDKPLRMVENNAQID